VATATKDTITTKVIDFSGVEDKKATFNKKRVPAGDYLAKVTAVKDAPTKETREFQWLFTLELTEKYTDRKFPYYCKLQENQLWKLRNLFIAAGIPVPKKKMKVDPTRIIGKLVGITLEDDEYDGKAQSNIGAVFPASELVDTEDEDTDEEYDAEDGEDEDDEDDTTDEADSAEEEDEEDEEPELAPKKRAVAKKAVPAQRKSSSRPEVTDDELEELELDDL
jgi:hypothetical protein